jgi:predicted NUDIX family phosphoesterase
VSQVTTERVLVVPTERFCEVGYFQGFCSEAPRYLAELLRPGQTSYLAREEAEQDPSFKQLIPYVIFRHRDAEGTTRLFQYVRGKGQGEGRLHSKRSIGVGGHINDDDGADRDEAEGASYREGMRRELAEEVLIQTPYEDRCVGLINDDETEVGRVHLGIVHLIDVEQPSVTPRESDLLDCGFVPIEEIRREADRLESWSRICLEHLFA